MEDDVSVEVDTDEGVTVVEEARELETRLKRAFGSAALTTRVEEEGERVVVNGDGWQFIARGDEVVFKPAGTPLRMVRSVNDLEAVEHDEGVVFVFGDEEFALRRGVEHRR
jgi:5-enolpyruvylshikimate-3-phosphate synthase